jgi:hypothetical protein
MDFFYKNTIIIVRDLVVRLFLTMSEITPET